MNEGRRFFTYKSFLNVNTEVTPFDYLHALASQVGMTPDDFHALSTVQMPELIEVEEQVFLKELFVVDKFEELKAQGFRSKKIQYWMNLVEFTGLFEGWPIESLDKVVEMTMAGWRAKLASEFPFKTFEVKRLLDQKEGELAVTFYSLD